MIITLKIRFSALRGADSSGYVALDDFEIVTPGTCEILPPEADPNRSHFYIFVATVSKSKSVLQPKAIFYMIPK